MKDGGQGEIGYMGSGDTIYENEMMSLYIFIYIYKYMYKFISQV
jgi:hypothetical protein